jgi:hypothetical protein
MPGGLEAGPEAWVGGGIGERSPHVDDPDRPAVVGQHRRELRHGGLPVAVGPLGEGEPHQEALQLVRSLGPLVGHQVAHAVHDPLAVHGLDRLHNVGVVAQQ